MQNHLADKRQAILILRLSLDGRGHFMHGEVVELEGKLIGRFAQWPQLLQVVGTWAASQEEAGGSHSPPNAP